MTILMYDNKEWINWIQQKKSRYLNKQKIQAIIAQQRTNLAEVGYLNLDVVSKIVDEFQNANEKNEKNRFSLAQPIQDGTAQTNK